MNQHVQPTALNADPVPPVDRFDTAVLRRYRLFPLKNAPDGWLWYADGAVNPIGVSSPSKHHEPPAGTDTILLSLNDYRRVTKAIADAEAGGA